MQKKFFIGAAGTFSFDQWANNSCFNSSFLNTSSLTFGLLDNLWTTLVILHIHDVDFD